MNEFRGLTHHYGHKGELKKSRLDISNFGKGSMQYGID